VIGVSVVKTSKAPAVRATYARCAPHSVAFAPSMRCLCRLRRPHGCPFESRPAPHSDRTLTPPQPRRPALINAGRLPRACCLAVAGSDRSQARATTPFFINTRRHRSRLFKYSLATTDLRYSLPLSGKNPRCNRPFHAPSVGVSGSVGKLGSAGSSSGAVPSSPFPPRSLSSTSSTSSFGTPSNV